MKPYAHTIEYKGYTITCVNGIYRITELPGKEYRSFNAAKAVVDKQEEPENFVNVKKHHR